MWVDVTETKQDFSVPGLIYFCGPLEIEEDGSLSFFFFTGLR